MAYPQPTRAAPLLALAPLVLVASMAGVADGSLGYATADVAKMTATGPQAINSVSAMFCTQRLAYDLSRQALFATCGCANVVVDDTVNPDGSCAQLCGVYGMVESL